MSLLMIDEATSKTLELGKVDEFTEKVVEIPLSIRNNKEYYNIKLFPKKVKITVFVALSNYANATDEEIKATIDLNEWKILKHNKFSVTVTQLPAFCKLVRVEPSSVDFIIEK